MYGDLDGVANNIFAGTGVDSIGSVDVASDGVGDSVDGFGNNVYAGAGVDRG